MSKQTQNVIPMPHGVGRHGQLLPLGAHVSHYRRDRSATVTGAWLDSQGRSKNELLGDNGITTQIAAKHFVLSPQKGIAGTGVQE